MERYAWQALVAEGKQDEYKKRHDEMWPEMAKELNRAGVHNYSIWLCGRTLFGYYECENGLDYSKKIHAESQIIAKWNEYMADILIRERDPETGEPLAFKEVFFLA
jgi:L-rhamnose mutarotase